MLTRRGFIGLMGTLPLPAVVPMTARCPDRHYTVVEIAQFASMHVTHVEAVGVVAYVRREDDCDRHIRLVSAWPVEDDTPFIVCEVMPSLPVATPRRVQVGDIIRVRGIRRFDDEDAPGHQHYEIHPVESIQFEKRSF